MVAIRNSQFAIRNSQFAIRNSQFAIRNSQFAIRNSQFAIRADYVIGRVFCQPLKKTFSHFCEEVFSVALEREVL